MQLWAGLIADPGFVAAATVKNEHSPKAQLALGIAIILLAQAASPAPGWAPGKVLMVGSRAGLTALSVSIGRDEQGWDCIL